jgi:hypothetical protein
MFHLAQVNVGITKGSMESEMMKAILDNLDPINPTFRSILGIYSLIIYT